MIPAATPVLSRAGDTQHTPLPSHRCPAHTRQHQTWSWVRRRHGPSKRESRCQSTAQRTTRVPSPGHLPRWMPAGSCWLVAPGSQCERLPALVCQAWVSSELAPRPTASRGVLTGLTQAPEASSSRGSLAALETGQGCPGAGAGAHGVAPRPINFSWQPTLHRGPVLSGALAQAVCSLPFLPPRPRPTLPAGRRRSGPCASAL